ncbi:alkaline phosphatase family protein [Snuella sedimenti]|uniref:Alkaline phosphatase family protein n=1 Tax=Snuella sedimenti TaxID=2798802 RepID=A0A8J7IQ17_9FLAO|nr:alkaline phosphatase family protein [Snuella sedimenti]MBJ6368937.1 alkaline phosphatase family protein [Snuella sedimenti]
MILKKGNYIVLISSFCLMVVGCSGSTNSEEVTDPNPEPEAIKNKVLIIGIDGCRPDALMVANTPNVDALISNATYSLDARCLFTTSSGPGWTSMLSGVWQDKHNVTNNSYSSPNFAGYPHFFKHVEQDDPDNRTVSIVQWNPINDYMASLQADVVINADTDDDVKNAVANELTNNDPTVLFVQLSNVDFAGHSTGFAPDNPNYINAIEVVDTQIGSIISALKKRKTYSEENWLVLLSTDHGGLGTSHGGPSDEERTIFVIASGDEIPNKKIEATTEQIVIPPANNCLNSNTELWFENAYAQVSHNSDFNFGSDKDFTLECRIRSAVAGDVQIIGKKNWSSGLNKGFVFSFSPSNSNFKVNVGDGANRVDVNAGEITDNEWHTVSTTFDRDGLLKVYVDGELKGSASMSSIGDIDNNLPFTIGADGNLNWKYKGYVAEVRLFDVLLDASDIDEWKCKVLDNTHLKYTNVLAHWKLTEGAGTDILDSAPNGHNGTLVNAVWKDATVSTVEIMKNYDNTPRTVDVAVTALNHLCIDIDSSWNLEGNSIIDTSCPN